MPSLGDHENPRRVETCFLNFSELVTWTHSKGEMAGLLFWTLASPQNAHNWRHKGLQIHFCL